MDSNLLSRLEERVIHVLDRLSSLEHKLLNGISERLANLETRVSLLEQTQNGWRLYGDFAFKVASTIVAAYICYRLGFPVH